MDEDCSYHNKVADRMKLKMHNKINLNNRWRGVEEKKGKITKGGEEECALDFKTLMS